MHSKLLLQRHATVAALAVLSFFGAAALSLNGFSQEKKTPEPAKSVEKGDPKPSTDDAKPDEKKPEVPPLFKVKEAPFEIKIELDGVFEAKKATEISLSPEAWADLTVVEVVPHGTAVKKGAVIARFDTEKLTDAIEDLETGAPLAELTLAAANAELEKLEKTTPLALESSRRKAMQSEENLAYYEDVTLPMQKKDVGEGLKRYEQSLAYAQEELDQLKKMYEADDMTEETEEIILLRSQNQVDSAKWALEQAKTRTDRSLNTTIPREHESLKLNLEQTRIEWRAGEKATRDELDKKRLEVEKARRDHEKAAKRLADLHKDLKMLTVTAPHDGIVYYGAASRGKWVTGPIVEKKLVPGGKIGPNEVILTVVDPSNQQIHVAVPEAKLKDLKPGLEGSASPAWDTDAKFKTNLETLAFVPFSDNTYDAVFSASKTDKDQVFPGMSAKITLDIYNKEKAIAVPKTAVKKEGEDHFVTLKDDKKQKVKVGKSSGSQTEILEGLKVGDEIKTK